MSIALRIFIVTAMVVGATSAGCGSTKPGGPRGTGGAAAGGGTQGNGGTLGTGGVMASGGLTGLGTGGMGGGAAGGSGGLGSGGAGTDGGKGGGGGPVDGSLPSDGGDARDAAADAHDGSADAPAVVCPASHAQGPAKSSSGCSISSFAFDATTVCGSTTGCPVGAAYSLRCSDSNTYGPWLVPNGATGATVLLASGDSASHLFTIGAGGTTRVDDVPALTSAIASLAVERDGTRTVLMGEMPGATRARETVAGWSTDEATIVEGNDLAMVGEGRSIDETHAFVAYFNLSDNLPRLAARDGSCWQTKRLGTTTAQAMAMDADAMGRPWVAWLGNSSAGLPTLSLVGPDGSSYAPWTGTAGNTFSFWYRPIVLTGGLGGSGAFPALGVQQTEGLHVITSDTDTAVWTDRMVLGSQQAVYTGDCPPSGPVTTGPACKGLTSCTQHGVGALSGFGLVRTASGRAYAAWLEIDSTSTLALTQSTPTCTSGGMPCMCQTSVTSVTRTLTLAVARLTNAATPDQAIRRFPIDSTTAPSGYAPSFFSLVMAARGETLLTVARLAMLPESQLLYLELDSSRLP